MSGNSRFQRIAHDLEKLPCELHDSILAELEFSQLVRLSLIAGPRLTWSLENSLLPTGFLFRDGATTEWQKCLAVTDKLRKFCFKTPKSKDHDTHRFSNLHHFSFLHRKSANWTQYSDCAALSVHWRQELCILVHRQIAYLGRDRKEGGNSRWLTYIDPWLQRLLAEKYGATAETCRQSALEVVEAFCNGEYKYPYLNRDKQPSIDELITFVDLYQETRVLRAEALAAVLHRLADLYEAHPSRLKKLRAPQTPPLNKKHVAERMRHHARRLVNQAKTRHWTEREWHGYRLVHRSSALVPYDWCGQLFQLLLARCDKEPVSFLPTEISSTVERVRANERLIQSVADESPEDQTETEVDPSFEEEYIRLKAMEGLCEVVSWMEHSCPEEVQKVKGS